MGFKVELRDGVHHLGGSIDEACDFDALAAARDEVLKLNLAGIQTINSLGLRRLIAFAKAIGERAVELFDCPPVFIEAVNVMPLAIGGHKHVRRIQSLLLPFHCKGDHEASFSVRLAEIRLEGESVLLPEPACPKCQQKMEPDLETDLDEFFFFLSV